MVLENSNGCGFAYVDDPPTQSSYPYLLVIAGMERQVAADHAIQHDPKAPYIHRRAIIQPSRHNLRGCIAGRPTVDLQLLARHGVSCQAKVNQLDPVGCVQQDVLQLHISVHNLHIATQRMINR